MLLVQNARTGASSRKLATHGQRASEATEGGTRRAEGSEGGKGNWGKF